MQQDVWSANRDSKMFGVLTETARCLLTETARWSAETKRCLEC